jgi:hypothetical protein
MRSLLDVAFPYRIKRRFGAASFALIFLVLLAEIEMLVFVALAIVAHRLDLFMGPAADHLSGRVSRRPGRGSCLLVACQVVDQPAR